MSERVTYFTVTQSIVFFFYWVTLWYLLAFIRFYLHLQPFWGGFVAAATTVHHVVFFSPGLVIFYRLSSSTCFNVGIRSAAWDDV